jgi:light-regulated signal transduction histidine kinase (bacteriophytochrome)/CheY-like chemotaxis protein
MNALPSVDLTNCDREPIHLLGAVQPFGFLIAVEPDGWKVRRASRNAAAWLGRANAPLSGLPLDALFTADSIHAIRGHLQIAAFANARSRIFNLEIAPDLHCDVSVHFSGGLIVIECEAAEPRQSFDAAAAVSTMVARINSGAGDRTFFRTAARDMRALTGFDRVMLYRFEHDGSGEVIAEAARAGLESYLGLHYPASDIPQQARILYERNWLRIIPDIDALPVPIEPQLDPAGEPLDLSLSTLRSVSAIHIEYLRNMGVGASMSVSILRHGRLWGLFACHHYGRHNVGFARRTAAELYGQMFSLLLENRERETQAAYEAQAQGIHQRLIGLIAAEGTPLAAIGGHLDEIADLIACDGVALTLRGRVSTHGITPRPDELAALFAHLAGETPEAVHATHEIATAFPPARAFAEHAAGMLVIPLSRPAGDFLVFFRQEVARQVSWAGQPGKLMTVGPLGERLTPRKSFELWKETVRGQSLPWSAAEKRIAENLRVSLLEVILRLTSEAAAERQRHQVRQELLIAELNHRVRNILSLIRGVISQSRDPSLTAEDFMQVVGGRIQALARAHDQLTAQHWGPASFRALLAAEAGAFLGTKAERLVISGGDAHLRPEAFTTVALVIHEMVTNSAKYGSLSDSRGRVDVAISRAADGAFTFDWTESGGPRVAPPTRRGFGSTVIERSIRHDLQGDAAVAFHPEGLAARFSVPLRYVETRPPHAAATDPAPARVAAQRALPADVLIVEDNMIIALDLEDMLHRLGVASVRCAGTAAEALRLIAAQPPAFALLDVNLGDGTSIPVAEALAAQHCPFVFASGYGEQVAFPAAFATVTRLRKPYAIEDVATVLGGEAQDLAS